MVDIAAAENAIYLAQKRRVFDKDSTPEADLRDEWS